ncbi:MAG: hypothetical protein F4X19_06245, partial [Acidobacteria bacterium]|nr:hypothetical protein [Acidobacteriota bacterium]
APPPGRRRGGGPGPPAGPPRPPRAPGGGGRPPPAPGWASSRDVVAPKEVHRSSCPFVFIRSSSSLATG